MEKIHHPCGQRLVGSNWYSSTGGLPSQAQALCDRDLANTVSFSCRPCFSKLHPVPGLVTLLRSCSNDSWLWHMPITSSGCTSLTYVVSARVCNDSSSLSSGLGHFRGGENPDIPIFLLLDTHSDPIETINATLAKTYWRNRSTS